MEKNKEKKGIGYYLMGIIIVVGYILILIAGSSGRPHGCYEDKYGNETCYEDPRN